MSPRDDGWTPRSGLGLTRIVRSFHFRGGNLGWRSRRAVRTADAFEGDHVQVAATLRTCPTKAWTRVQHRAPLGTPRGCASRDAAPRGHNSISPSTNSIGISRTTWAPKHLPRTHTRRTCTLRVRAHRG